MTTKGLDELNEERKNDEGEVSYVPAPGLRIVQKRTACDGFIPNMKAVAAEEIRSVEDLQAIPDHLIPEIARNLIHQDDNHLDTKLSQALMRRLYDKDGSLMEQLYYRINRHSSRVYSDKKGSTSSSASGSAQWMTMTGESYNLMIQSALLSSSMSSEMLAQLVFESTVLGMPLDT